MYEEELKAFLADTKGSLVRGTDVRKPGFLGRVGSNVDLQRSGIASRGLTQSLMVLSPSSRGGGVSQSVADFTSSGSFGSPDHASRPK